MNLIEMFIAASIVLLAVSLVTLTWFVTAQVEDDLRVSSGFEGLHFEI